MKSLVRQLKAYVGARSLRARGVAAGLLAAGLLAAPLVQAQYIQRSFLNGSFESPSLNTACSVQLPEGNVAGWSTNHPSVTVSATPSCVAAPLSVTTGPLIEMWSTGFLGGGTGQVNAVTGAGSQFAELNAQTASTLYQTVCLVAGETMNYSFLHRGRGSDTTPDVLKFSIYDTPASVRQDIVTVGTTRTGTMNAGTAAVPSASPSPILAHAAGGGPTGALVSDGWVRYAGQITVPATSGGLKLLGLAAVSAAGGATVGNLLDDFVVTLRPVIELASAATSARESSGVTGQGLRPIGNFPASVPVQITVAPGAAPNTAIYGTDYTTPSGTNTFSVTIPAGNYDGSTIFPLGVAIVDNALVQNNRVLTFTMGTSSTYNISSATSCGAPGRNSATHTIVDNDVDLSVTKTVVTGQPTQLNVGQTTQFDVVYSNASAAVTGGALTVSPVDAHNGRFVISDAQSPELTYTAWTCTASGGAACPAASGIGSIAANNASLPTGGQLSYRVTAQMTASAICGASQANPASILAAGSVATGNGNDGVALTEGGNATAANTASAAVSRSCANISVVASFPAYAPPGTTVSGTLTCSAAATPPSGYSTTARSMTCGATGLPAGATISCAPTPPADIAAGSPMTCNASFLAPANGMVNIVPTTSALNATSVTGATVPVAVIDAVNDGVATVPPTGATIPLIGNDTVGGAAATLGASGNISLPTVLSGLPPGASIDPATGGLIVASGTPAGSYTVTYQICVRGVTPAVCDTASLSISIAPSDMTVQASGFAAYAAPGSTVTGTVTCTAAGATALNATCGASGLPAGASVSCTPSAGPATLAVGASLVCNVSFTAPATGLVNVLGVTNASNDSSAANNQSSAPVQIIDAADDGTTTIGVTGGAVNLLSNDTVGAVAATIGTGGITAPVIVSGAPSGASINASGQLVIPAATTPGSYLVTYRICAQGAPAVCDTAQVTVQVTAVVVLPSDMSVATANFPSSAAPGSTVTGAITCTASGSLATAATCGATGLSAGAVLNCSPTPPTDLAAGSSIVCSVSFTAPQNGVVTLTARTGASNDSNPANNAAAAVSVNVIDANNDAATVNFASLPATIDLLTNDTLGGVAATMANVTVTLDAGAPAGFTLNGSGQLVVPTGTSSGSYTVPYTICDRANPLVCDSAYATIAVPASDMSVALSGFPVYAAPGSTVTGTITCTATGNTALDATCAATGLPSGAVVSCVDSSPQATLAAGSSMVCSVSYVAPFSGVVNVTGLTGASNDSAASNNSVNGQTLVIAAVDDAPVVMSAAGGTVNVLGNDTLGAVAATGGTGGNVVPTVTGGAPTGFTFTFNASGQLVIPPGLPGGAYTVTYQICAAAAPTVCASATVPISVPSAGLTAVLSGFPVSAAPGSAVSGRLVCTASGNAALNAACGMSGLPAGAIVSCTPPSPAATLADGASIICDVSFTAPANGLQPLAGTATATGVSAVNATGTIKIIDAVNDASVTISSAGGLVTLIGNDTLGGTSVTIGAGASGILVPQITNAGGLAGASINSSGQLVVPAASAAGTYTLTYQICAADRPAACDSATAVVQINVTAPIGVKYARNASNPGLPLTAGQQAEWTIIYSNPDSGPYTYFQVTDAMDANLSGVSIVSVTSGSGLMANPAYTGAGANTTLLTPGGTLNALDKVTIVVRGTINAGFTGTLSNQASATTAVLAGPLATSAVGPATPACSAGPPAVVAPCVPAGITIPATAIGGQSTTAGASTQAQVLAAASLSGQIWVDANGDRQRQAGETASAGYQVRLYFVNPDGSRGAEVTNPASRPVTDASGNYTIANLIPTRDAGGAVVGLKYEAVFYNPAGQAILGVPAAQNTDTTLNGTVPSATRNRITAISVTPGGNTSNQNLPLDPSGIVYDSATRLPLTGAGITITGPAGFNPATHLASGVASYTTGADGMYQFFLTASAPAGTYQLAVTTPPAGYSASTQIPSSGTATPGVTVCPGLGSGSSCPIQPQAGAPQPGVNPSTTYYLSLVLNPATSPDVVHNHIPLDSSSPPALFISKVANRTTVEIGETVRYTVRVRYASGTLSLPALSIVDSMPAGFKLLEGTSFVSAPTGSAAVALPVANIAGAPGAVVTYTIPLSALPGGSLAVGQELELTYRLRAGVGSLQGDGINRAQALSLGTVRSNVAQARVKVNPGVFTSEACIVGKVFLDCDGDRLQDTAKSSQELGVPGVRLYLQDGTYLVSDSEGKYSLCGLEPRSHVLKLDPLTLPDGAYLLPTSNRNLGNGNSLWLDLKNGELQQADFAVAACTEAVLHQVQQRRGQGEIRSIDIPAGRKAQALRFDSREPDNRSPANQK